LTAQSKTYQNEGKENAEDQKRSNHHCAAEEASAGFCAASPSPQVLLTLGSPTLETFLSVNGTSVFCRHQIRMGVDSRASEFPSRSNLDHLVIVLIRRRVLLRRRDRRLALRTRGVPISIVLVPSNSGVVRVSPLIVGLVRMMVIVSIVAAVRIVRPIVVRVVVSGVVVSAISLAELVTILLLLLWGTSVVVPGVRVVVL